MSGLTDEDLHDPHAARDALNELGAKLEGIGSTFGTHVSLTSDVQQGDDMVLLCYNFGWGEQCESIALPHQIYLSKLKELIKNNPGISSVSITPISSSRRVSIPRDLVEAL